MSDHERPDTPGGILPEGTPREDASPTVSRRAFLALGAGAGALAGLGVTGCSAPDPLPDRTGAAGPMPLDPGAVRVPSFGVEEVSLADLRRGMESGRWSAREVTEAYLRRIEATNHDGPALRAVIETSPDALEIAEERDRERAEGRLRGPLHGVPILLKDNIATGDRTTTTAGSLALEGSISPEDAAVAARLREAGAILLGKANLSEWANFRGDSSTSGWSARGGQTRNPYVLDRNPCGSSSGSGVAAAASLAAAAIGTETNGSIVCPAHANGVVGFKPTVGLAGRSRIIPISHTQDTAGPMTRTVEDAAIVLGAMTGVDPLDPATEASRGNVHDDYTRFLDADLSGLRIGVGREFFGFHPEVDDAMEEAVAALRGAGAEVVDDAQVPNRQQAGGPSFQVMLYEYKAGLAEYFRLLGPDRPVASLADVIAFNEANADRELRWFGQELMEQAEEMGPLTDRDYLDALERAGRLSREEGLDAALDQGPHGRLDAIVAPTGGPAWATDLVNGDNYGGGSSGPAAISGYPNVTVPAGYVGELPVGMSIFGRRWSEPTLLRIAYGFEQATNHRRPPRYLRSWGSGAPV